MEQLIIGFSDSFPHCKAAVPRSVGMIGLKTSRGLIEFPLLRYVVCSTVFHRIVNH